MTFRAPHLADDRLYDHYYAGRLGEAVDPIVFEHLSDCSTCAARFDDVVRVLDDLRHEADRETAAIFTPERLRAQQQDIARRIEHVGHTARVISFPRQLVQRTLTGSTSHPAPRWLAAAAAAGLFVGVALGAGYEWEHARGMQGWALARPAAGNADTPRLVRSSDVAIARPEVAADYALLSELEGALDRPHTLELQPLDDFTPHIREILDIR